MKMNMKLKENYDNQFLVTQNGQGFFKEKYTEADDEEFEIKQLLKDKTLIRESTIIENTIKKNEIFVKPLIEKPQVIFDDNINIIEDIVIDNKIIDKAPSGVKEIITKNNKKKFSEKDNTISE